VLPPAEDFLFLEKAFLDGIEIWMKSRSNPAVNTCHANLPSSSAAKRSKVDYSSEGFLPSRTPSQAEDTEMVITDAIPLEEPMCIRTPDDEEEIEFVMHRILLDQAGMSVDIADSCRAAVRQLMLVATCAQRKHVQQIYRHGRHVTEGKSMPLEQRLLEEEFPFHDPRKSGYSLHQFDDIGNLFRPLHAGLGGLPSMQRMQNALPEAATNAAEFHHRFAKMFLKNCEPPWFERNTTEKLEYLRSWFISKFSLHPKNACMLPGPGKPRKKRNDACWLGVEITDEEMEQVVTDSFRLYCAESQLRF
jgi:hypothetical protein